MSKEFEIKLKTSGIGVWKGLGGHQNFPQCIFELTDNGISSFDGNGTALEIITVQQLPDSSNIKVSIEDNGSGFKNINAAMSLGKTAKSGNLLNMYGMGIKQALASVNPTNDHWSICTRTKDDLENGSFRRIKAPYKSESFYGEIVDDEAWPGIGTGTGTIVTFVCDSSFFKTLTQPLTKVKDDFRTISDILFEEIGHTYSKLIEDGIVRFIYKVKPYNKAEETYVIDPLKPMWNINSLRNGCEVVDLGQGPFELKFKVGTIIKLPDRKIFDNSTSRIYYKEKVTSSGCEIRLNGRTICSNIFHDIWPQQRHNKYNKFLMIVDVVADDIDKLPPPQTTKINFIKGDSRLEKLYEWIRTIQMNPIGEKSREPIEIRLFKELAKQKEDDSKTKGNTCIINLGQPVFQSLGNGGNGVYADMYERDKSGVVIYEGKRCKSQPIAAYQLRMYWDGLVKDGIKTIKKGILIAASHSQNVINIIDYLNQLKDSNGNQYNFELKCWSDYGIDVNSLLTDE